MATLRIAKAGRIAAKRFAARLTALAGALTVPAQGDAALATEIVARAGAAFGAVFAVPVLGDAAFVPDARRFHIASTTAVSRALTDATGVVATGAAFTASDTAALTISAA